MSMRLFHFSDDPNIEIFLPRPVRVPSQRPAGREWLNGPLVWAIDEHHQPMYLFPRECPRILAWPRPETTTAEDYEQWRSERSCRMVAHIESAWLARLKNGVLYRYELPDAPFESLHDAGMWIARTPVSPIKMKILRDLPAKLHLQDVELRVADSLVPLKSLWATTLHVSGIRLRNAQEW